MTEKEIVKKMFEVFSMQFNKTELRDILRMLNDLAYEELVAGRSWKIPSIGTISVNVKHIRVANGKVVKSKRLPRFVAAKALKEGLNK